MTCMLYCFGLGFGVFSVFRTEYINHMRGLSGMVPVKNG